MAKSFEGYLADFVGIDVNAGDLRRRMCAGPILERMDMLAGALAYKHANGPVATVSFDRVELLSPIFHGDLIRLEGQLVLVGNSSMVIQISGFRHDMYLNEFVQTHNALVTMVAIQSNGKPRKGLNPLPDNSSSGYALALKRKALAKKWMEDQEAVDQLHRIKLSQIETGENSSKDFQLAIAKTLVEVQRGFLPRHENPNKTIFGGDVLTWMDKAALYCAQNFTKNVNMVTISMDQLEFAQCGWCYDNLNNPLVNLRHRRYTLDVEIQVFAGETEKSHTGYFTVLNLGDGDTKRRILTGLQLSEDHQEDLATVLKAQRRHAFNNENKAVLMLHSLPISKL